MIALIVLPVNAIADETQSVINILEHNAPDSAAEKATLYLKRLIEQRTNNRLQVAIHRFLPESKSENELSVEFQMAVIDKLNSLRGQHKLAGGNLVPVGTKQLENYQLLIDSGFLGSLSDELSIILRGAVNDTLSYRQELEKK